MTNDPFKCLRLAEKLNETHRELLLTHPARFRGDLKSMSLICLRLDASQRGLSGLSCEEALLTKNYIKELLNHPEMKERPGRPIPKKRVQSCVIHQAMLNDGKLEDGALALCRFKALPHVSPEF